MSNRILLSHYIVLLTLTLLPFGTQPISCRMSVLSGHFSVDGLEQPEKHFGCIL